MFALDLKLPREYDSYMHALAGMAGSRLAAVGERLAHREWRLQCVALAALMALATANFVLVYQRILLSRGPLHWDEASHALQGLVVATDLRSGDFLAFLFDSYRQVYWPPVFSWVAGLVFLLAGAGTESARISSLIWLLPLPVFLFLAGRRLQPAAPWVSGFLAAGLALTSASLADMGSYAMLEAPGVLVLTAGIWLYLRFVDQPTIRGSVLLGLVMMLTYLTKSNYGVLLVLGVVVERLLQCRLDPKAAFWRAPWRYAFLTLGAGLTPWFAYLPKLRNSWTALVNSPYGPVDAYTIDGLLYYPRALASLVGPMWLAVLVLTAVALSLTRMVNPKVRFLVILLLIQMAFATWSTTKAERHIATMLPPLFLVASFWLAWLVHRLREWRAWPGAALAALAPLLVLALSFQAFYGEVLSRPLASAPSTNGAFRLVRDLAGRSRLAGPMLLASTDDMAPPQIDWYLATEGKMQVWASGSLVTSHQFPSRVVSGILPRLSDALAQIQERGNEPGVTRTIYTGFPMDVPQLLTEEDYAEGILQTATRYKLRTVAVVLSQKDSVHYQKGLVEKTLEANGYRLADVKDFPDDGAMVKTYVHEDASRPLLTRP